MRRARSAISSIRDDLFDVLGADYHTLARIDAPRRTRPVRVRRRTRARRASRLASRRGRGVASFVRARRRAHPDAAGTTCCSCSRCSCRGGGLLALAKIVTAFTLAHSVTLALAVLDVVALPDRLVEAVIALSIAAVAAENLFAGPRSPAAGS